MKVLCCKADTTICAGCEHATPHEPTHDPADSAYTCQSGWEWCHGYHPSDVKVRCLKMLKEQP